MKRIKTKAIEWTKRYLPAELFGIIGVFLGGFIFNSVFHTLALTAIGGTIGENVGYYGTIVYQDIRKRQQKEQKVTFLGIIKVIRNAMFEFGVAEYADLIIRPTAMYLFPKIMENIPLGLIIGKFVADITFYAPAIIFYELRKKVLTD
jgi:hypothetical protein